MGHRTRHGGSWRTTTQPSVRWGGSWRTVTAGWIRQGGVWVKWWPDLPDRGGPFIFGSLSSTGPGVASYDGSSWSGVGGGLSLDVTQLSVGNDGTLRATNSAGTTLRAYNGTSWSTVSGVTTGVDRLMWGPMTALGYGSGAHWTAREDIGTGTIHIDVDGAISGGWEYTDTSPPAFVSQFAVNDLGCLAVSDGNFDSPASSGRAWSVDTDYGAGVSGTSASLSATGDQVRLGLDGQIYATRSSAGTYYLYRMATANVFTLLGSTGFNGQIRDIVALPDGRVWACGAFTTVDGSSITGLAEWNGTAWSQVSTGLAASYAMSYHQSKLWILEGATLTNRNVYSWDGTTLALVTNFSGDTVRGLA